MTLNLVCDISGSMGDGGKTFIMRTVVMAVAQWVRLGYAHAEIRLNSWASDTLDFLDWNTKDEWPAKLLSCGGISKGEALIQWLGEKPEGRVLLFTDGYCTWDKARGLKHWMECLPPDTLRVIKIGTDANPQLKGPNVFAADDLFIALDDWLERGVA
jgi:hypothetical protein